jgi:N-formylglutamate amidohydrolase
MQYGEGPLVSAATHDGHAVRHELAELFALDEDQRLREEDPFTGMWTSMASTRIVGLRSRFEVDLNRPRDECVYRRPEDAWGLTVWKQPLADGMIERSRSLHDAFYRQLRVVLESLVEEHGRVVVFDLHSYNHRRLGPDEAEDDPERNPEINIGTGTMQRSRWGTIVDRFITQLQQFNYHGRQLDVRENVRFRGGYLPRWIHEQFSDTVCAIAIEVKKFFMDEWTGHPDQDHLYAIGQALQQAADGVREELARFEQAQPTS